MHYNKYNMRIQENHAGYLKEDFADQIIENDPVCPICGGDGEVTTMEPVYSGEPHMAPIGTRKCECQLIEEDAYE
jgi:hypothetical protein